MVNGKREDQRSRREEGWRGDVPATPARSYIDNESMLCYKLLFRNSKKSEGAIRDIFPKPS
jgi:hypothetical protein